MARIKHRTRADGGISYQVCWVLGGGRAAAGVREQAETFTDLNRAAAFKLDVEHACHQWPAGWVKGEGYVDRDEMLEPSGPTVADVAARFWPALDRRVQRGRLKAYTLHRYRRVWALHLEPSFGGLAFADVTVADVEDWVDTEVDAGSSAKSIRNWHGLLHSIMAYGQQRQHLRPDNPCAATELPEVSHRAARQVRFFSDMEWIAFRSALKDDVVLLCDYLLATGLRWGEVSALRIGDVTTNSDEMVAQVVRAWSGRSPDDPDPIDWMAGEAKVWKLGPPKNKRSRYVVVSGDVARRLANHIEGRDPDEYVFTRRKQPWRYDGFHEDRWKPACKAVSAAFPGKRFTPHMLRHSCVVWALAQGARIEQVSEMLGHSSIQITYDIYGGLLDLRDPAVARAMAKAMAGVSRSAAETG